MNELILTAFGVFGIVAVLAAVLLYFTEQKFKVEQNVLAEQIEDILPKANCGACGRAGCADFARVCSKAGKEEFSELYCPVGGMSVMSKIAALLGFEAKQKAKQFAVVHCQGSCEKSPKKVEYSGFKSCRLESMISAGEGLCPSGCLHLGDCVSACKFDAIHIDEQTKLPVVDIEKCVACGACVSACPRKLIELKSFDAAGNLIYVACKNTQTGAQAMKNCKAACIACSKCAKVCPDFVVENNLAQIKGDVDAQKYAVALVESCPNKVIVLKKENKNEKE